MMPCGGRPAGDLLRTEGRTEVVRSELLSRPVFPGEQSAGQRDPGQDAEVEAAGGGKDLGFGAEIEAVVDDLQHAVSPGR